MSAREKALRTEKVEVIVGNRHFQVQPQVAKRLILVISDAEGKSKPNEDPDEDDDEGSIPAEEVIPELLDEKKRPATMLRGLRAREDMTQEELAAKIKRPQSWISQMESATRPIGPKMAVLLGKAFNVDPNLFSSTLVTEDSELFLDDFIDDNDRMVGSRMKYLRKKAQMSQSELAAKLSISQAELSKLESGSKILSISRANAIAAIFKRSVEFLISGKLEKQIESGSKPKRSKAG